MDSCLWSAVKEGHLDQVKLCLASSNINVNLVHQGGGDDTVLHLACSLGFLEITEALLNHPDIDVNPQNRLGFTPFYKCCADGEEELVRLFLKDPRLRPNIAALRSKTPMWIASRNGRYEVVRWMLALRGDELDMQKKGNLYGELSSPLEIAREKKKPKVSLLLERFQKNPAGTQHELRLQLRQVEALTAQLFATVVFLCDDFLSLPSPDKRTPAAATAVRFFNIGRALPMELQMVLCRRVYGSSKQHVLSKDSEMAFWYLAQHLLPTKK